MARGPTPSALMWRVPRQDIVSDHSGKLTLDPWLRGLLNARFQGLRIIWEQ